MKRAGDRLYHVLLVEDNQADTEVVRLLLSSCGLNIDLFCAGDGVQGSDYLFARGLHADRPLPDLVLIDLNLPRKDGREVLKEMKAAPQLKEVPALMLTTTKNEREVKEAYSLGANAFLCKQSISTTTRT